jgi:hypothetical protein
MDKANENRPTAYDVSVATLALLCQLAEKLTGQTPVVKVRFGERHEHYVAHVSPHGDDITWIPAASPKPEPPPG